MKTEEIYTLKCAECHRVFRSNNAQETLCPDCIKYKQPRKRGRKKKPPKKVLTFAEILHIAEVYNKVNHKYLHYGDIVALTEHNVDRCVCCGAVVPEGRQVCPQCERAV